jgi:hypothetical protein
MNNDEQLFSDSQLLRMKAEEKLKLKDQETHMPANETDIKRLLHELQVHQIELEMQYEELRMANETAEAALKKYTMLYDLAPLGFFILSRDGSICELNFTGAEILDDRRFSLVKSNFKLFVSEETRPVFNDFFTRLYTSNSKESCEITIASSNKTSRFVYIEGIVTGDDQKCLLSVIDISAFK